MCHPEKRQNGGKASGKFGRGRRLGFADLVKDLVLSVLGS